MRPTLGERLRELRLAQKLDQYQVAKRIGVDRSAISQYENEIRQPSFDVIVSLANLYRVSTDYLLGKDEARLIDISGLTETEIQLISELVSLIAKKNEEISKEKQ